MRVVVAGTVVAAVYTAVSLGISSLTERRAIASAGVLLTIVGTGAVAGVLVNGVGVGEWLFMFDLEHGAVRARAAAIYGETGNVDAGIRGLRRRQRVLGGARGGHHLVALPAHRGDAMSWPAPTEAPTIAAPLIEIDHVSKWFGDVVAVSDVAFSVGPGITALLGPNGAGKSTVLRLMCGLARPSQGPVRVLGGDPRRDLSILGRIGLVPQQEAHVREPHRSSSSWRRRRGCCGCRIRVAATERALAEVEVSATDRRPVRALSKGNRQRVKVASALVHDPEILVLDEPLNGLDPRQRLHLIDLVRRLAARPGRGVVISSHVLDEVERFGSRILVIAQGRLAAEGDFRAIRDLMDDRPHRLRIATDAAGRFAAGLLEAGVASGVRVTSPETLEVETTDVHGFRRAVAVIARDRGLELDELVPLDDDLDSVFRYLVGR